VTTTALLAAESPQSTFFATKREWARQFCDDILYLDTSGIRADHADLQPLPADSHSLWVREVYKDCERREWQADTLARRCSTRPPPTRGGARSGWCWNGSRRNCGVRSTTSGAMRSERAGWKRVSTRARLRTPRGGGRMVTTV